MHKKILLTTFFLLFALTVTAQTNKSKTAEQTKNKFASYVIAVCRDANAVEILDADTLQSLARITVGEAPHEAVGTAEGRTVYVANYGTKEKPGNSLSVIDLAARKEVKRVDLGVLQRPHGLQESGGKIYFTAEGSKTVGRYDPKTDKVDWTAKTDQMVSHMLAVSGDGKKIYTANMLSSSVTAIDSSGGGDSKITQIAVGKEPEGIALSPDGKTLWIGHRKEGLVTVIDTATSKVIETLTAGKIPLRMSYSPNGKQIWVINPNEGALIIFDAATRKETAQVAFDGAPVGIVFALDGKRVYVTDLKNNKVVAIDAQKFTVVSEKSVETLSDGIGFAAAGKR